MHLLTHMFILPHTHNTPAPTCTCSHICTRSLTHTTHQRPHIPNHTHALILSHTYDTPAPTHTWSHTQTHSHSVKHTTCQLPHTPVHTYVLIFFLRHTTHQLPHIPVHTHALILSHTHNTPAPTHTWSHTHTHSLLHTHQLPHTPAQTHMLILSHSRTQKTYSHTLKFKARMETEKDAEAAICPSGLPATPKQGCRKGKQGDPSVGTSFSSLLVQALTGTASAHKVTEGHCFSV